MKFKTPFHKNITIIAISMMLGMICMSIGAEIYDFHLHGGSFNWADLYTLVSLEQVKEVTAYIESIIVTVAHTVIELLRNFFKG